MTCPTRELAAQVTGELQRLGRCLPNLRVLSIVGGTPSRQQKQSLAAGAHVLVGTPGRLLDLLQREVLCLTDVNTFVLDEAGPHARYGLC